jgi:hypothetical protein
VTEQATVVYADILGFSDLVMSTSGAIDLLDGFYYSAMSPGSFGSRSQRSQFQIH